jgi:TatD DNase family protein
VLLIDTHTHIYSDVFDEDRNQMIERAINRGVRLMLMPNVDSSSTQRMLEVNRTWPQNCLPMMALHPCSVDENVEKEMQHVTDELKTGKYCAVGETGIDMYWDTTHLEAQKVSFRKHILLALEYDLPLVIHARSSFEEIFKVMDEFQETPLRGVFHCFSGDVSQGQKCLSYPGFYLGIGGVITYKKSGLAEVLQALQSDRLLLETDAPYLSPVPHRGKRNEPAYIPYILEHLSQCMGRSVEEMAELTSKNAMDLFRLKLQL